MIEVVNRIRPVVCFLLLFLPIAASAQGAPAVAASSPDADALKEAVDWIRATSKISAQYDYSMAVRVRMLVFWMNLERVGGGYIRRRESPDDPRLRSIEVLFGSDPARTKGVNRWGAGTEVMRLAEASGAPGGVEGKDAAPDVVTSAFLGFMKASKGDSVTAMQKELSKEQESNTHLFDATVTRADRGRALARTTPFASAEDYNFRQLQGALHTVIERLDKTDRPIRQSGASGSCDRPSGFLSTIEELLDAAVAGKPAPISRCYYFNARAYTATLKSWKLTQQSTTHDPAITYRNTVRASFSVLNLTDKKTSTFDLVIPRDGPWKGVQVEIVHQPNWWFQIILSLQPSAAVPPVQSVEK
jgi:hypothetical protein